MTTIYRSLFLLIVSAVLTACGGGGGGGGSSPTPTVDTPDIGNNGPTTASVTVLLTDAPGTDWDEAHATITSIALLGNQGPQTIFDGSTTVDLLSLPDFYEVFAIAEDVLPDTFEKIRLFVDELILIERDEDGAIIQEVAADLVGNGKIDLNPQGSFAVGPGDSLYIEIDFDMRKAFKTTTTGNGRVIVRPVVLVTVTSEPPLGRLTRLRGIINDIDAEDFSFDLCQESLVSEMDGASDDDDDDDGDDGDDDDSDDDDHHRHCLEVVTDEFTGLFGEDGTPVTFDMLEPGLLATAIGHLRRDEDDYDDDDDDDDEDDEDDSHDYDDVVLHAVTVEIGDAFLRVAGVAESIVEGDVFDLGLEPGQQLGTDQEVLATQVYPMTRVFGSDGEELDFDMIVPGVGVLADGVLIQEDGVDDLLRAALVILDLDISSDEEVARGQVVSVDFDAGTFQLMVEGAEVCINANEADIFLVSNADGFLSERVGLGDLQPDQQTDVFWEGTDDTGCAIATNVLASALPGNTLPVADAGEDQTVAAGASVMLDGSASGDDDGDSLIYAWTLASAPEGSTASLSAADTAMPSFTADVAGEYVIELVVNDGLEDSAPDSVTVTAE